MKTGVDKKVIEMLSDKESGLKETLLSGSGKAVDRKKNTYRVTSMSDFEKSILDKIEPELVLDE